MGIVVFVFSRRLHSCPPSCKIVCLSLFLVYLGSAYVCKYGRMCAGVCVCVHSGACAHVNVEATIRCLPLFLSLNLDLSVRLASGPVLCAPSQCEGFKTRAVVLCFLRVLGSELSSFTHMVFTDGSISPALNSLSLECIS